MAFDYIRNTKNAYDSVEAAQEYQWSYSGPLSWRSYRFHFIARKEREAVYDLLGGINPRAVLDLPCGSGKLAPVMLALGCKVVAGDISTEMLPLARRAYDDAGLPGATLLQIDAEHVAEKLGAKVFDVAVCLRLMHRVPGEIREAILGQLAATSRVVVVSFGVDSYYLRVRKFMSRLVFGGEHQVLCNERLANIRAEIARHFRIVRAKWVAPLLSEEIIFLLEAKR